MKTILQYREELAQILGVPTMRLPAVFQGPRPKALKVGVFFDLLKVFPKADRDRLSDWLGDYTSSRTYLRRIVVGWHRHDLAGANIGRIPAADRERARRRLALLDTNTSTITPTPAGHHAA
jgi:sRNA-binding protein